MKTKKLLLVGIIFLVLVLFTLGFSLVLKNKETNQRAAIPQELLKENKIDPEELSDKEKLVEQMEKMMEEKIK